MCGTRRVIPATVARPQYHRGRLVVSCICPLRSSDPSDLLPVALFCWAAWPVTCATDHMITFASRSQDHKLHLHLDASTEASPTSLRRLPAPCSTSFASTGKCKRCTASPPRPPSSPSCSSEPITSTLSRPRARGLQSAPLLLRRQPPWRRKISRKNSEKYGPPSGQMQHHLHP